jgi:CheY-like chemotaxis protein
VVLPLVSAQGETGGPDVTAEQGLLRILAVDDNATNQKVVELMLEAIGAEVVLAKDGAEALNAVAAGRFDVILMDMQMPVMDGLAATRAIRQLNNAPPVIMVSANNTPADRAASAQAGACAHVGKPFRVEELISTIMAALDVGALSRVA